MDKYKDPIERYFHMKLLMWYPQVQAIQEQNDQKRILLFIVHLMIEMSALLNSVVCCRHIASSLLEIWLIDEMIVPKSATRVYGYSVSKQKQGINLCFGGARALALLRPSSYFLLCIIRMAIAGEWNQLETFPK